MRREIRALAALALVFATGACTRIENVAATVPFFAFMRDAPFFDPYEAPRPAPVGSVPYESPAGEVLPPIQPSEAGLQAFAAGPNGTNPFAGEDLTQLGKTMYDRYCAVCHGPEGRGNGSIVSTGPGDDRYPPIAPDLTQPITLARPDGYLYGMIRVARSGLMPSYGARTTHRERWAIVTYVRQLQAAAGATAPGGGS